MQRSREAAARIQEIEAQQDEILRQLEELERRTETLLAEHLPRGRGEPTAPAPAGAPSPGLAPDGNPGSV